MKKYMEELVKKIEQHSYDYYVLDNPTVDDVEYDSLTRELKNLEQKYPEDILPNTPEDEIRSAFKSHIVSDTREIWFGHYHYEVEKNIDNIMYRCVRPVGHHRDHDIRASYSIYENGVFTNYRIPYDLEKTVFDIDNIDCLDEKTNKMWKELLRNAFHEEFLKKDIIQMKINDEKR